MFPDIERGLESNVACMFYIPRVTKSLWPASVRSGDISPLLKFIKCRAYDGSGDDPREEIESSRGYGIGIWSYEGIKWFSSARSEILGFVACEACYENFILATPFGIKFVPRMQEEGQSWERDVANKYIKRALLQTGRDNDREGFVGKANVRLKVGMDLSSCVGLKRATRSCKWWTLKGYAEGVGGSDGEGMFLMFEPCYLDHG